jgi:hypothetical protein
VPETKGKSLEELGKDFFDNFEKKKMMEIIDPKESAKLREMIEKAIEDDIITREEYEQIIHQALKDGQIDRVEKALLAELNQMIQDKTVKFKKG